LSNIIRVEVSENVISKVTEENFAVGELVMLQHGIICSKTGMKEAFLITQLK
jgi:hypothetical protein